MADERPYRTPVLTIVFYLFAVFYALVSGYLALVAAALPTGSDPGNPMRIFEWLPCSIVLFVALLCAGVGQLIDFIGRAAFNSAQAVSAIDEHGEAVRLLLSTGQTPPVNPPAAQKKQDSLVVA